MRAFILAGFSLLIAAGHGASAQDAVLESFLSATEKAANKFDYAGAEKFLKLAEREAEGDEGKLAQIWARQAPLAEMMFDYAKAEDLFKKGLAQAEKAGDRPLAAHRQTVLANHYRMRGKFDLSEPLYRKVLIHREKFGGPKSWQTARLLRDIADNHRDAGRLDAAETLYRRAIGIDDEMEDRKYHMAFCLANLGENQLRQDKLEEAEALCRQALDVYDQQKAPVSFNRALCYATLGESLRRQKKLDEAGEAFKAALKHLQNPMIQPARSMHIYANAAKCCRAQGKTEEANSLDETAKSFAAKHADANAAAAKKVDG